MKKIISVLLCLSLIFTVSAGAKADWVLSTEWIYGDVTWDGRIDATDALWVLLFSIHYGKLFYNLNPDPEQPDYWTHEMTMESSPHLVLYDVDLSYRIDAGDALMILQRSVRLIDSFPADGVPLPPH